MGSYLNPGNKGFQESLNSAIYVDKTGFIEKMNAVLNTRHVICEIFSRLEKEHRYSMELIFCRRCCVKGNAFGMYGDTFSVCPF